MHVCRNYADLCRDGNLIPCTFIQVHERCALLNWDKTDAAADATSADALRVKPSVGQVWIWDQGCDGLKDEMRMS
jgi:hypothetical protein